MEHPVNDDRLFRQRLSPLAHAFLETIQRLEAGEEVTAFQGETELKHITQMVSTYRGSLLAALTNRLHKLLTIDDAVIVTQREISTLIEEIWLRNITRFSNPELRVMQALSELSSPQLSHVAEVTGLSYAQARRAMKHLIDTQVVRVQGILNTQELGLERLLVILENPSLVISSPYVEKIFFADGSSSLVFVTILVPNRYLDEIMALVRSLRSTSDSSTVWHLHCGHLRFSDTYFTRASGEWNIDLVHFRLQLRLNHETPAASHRYHEAKESIRLTRAESMLLDALRQDYTASTLKMNEMTGLSESTIFKKRGLLTRDLQLILPRMRINIPGLSERLLILLSTDTVPAIRYAWSQLPLSFSSRVFNAENSDLSKAIMMAAVPPGTGWHIANIILEETSAIDDLSIHVISAGTDQQLSVSSLFNHSTGSWRWNSGDFLDVRGRAIVRREASPFTIPLDLAT